LFVDNITKVSLAFHLKVKHLNKVDMKTITFIATRPFIFSYFSLINDL